MDYQVLRNELKDIRNWIFDLDDTLYPPSPEIYEQMAQRQCIGHLFRRKNHSAAQI